MPISSFGSIDVGSARTSQSSTPYPGDVNGGGGPLVANDEYQHANGVASGSNGVVNGYGQHYHDSAHDSQLINHMFDRGFQFGDYADTVVHTHRFSWKLHALHLSRSPYLAHLMNTSPKQNGMYSIYIPVENIPEVTVEGISIVLGYLYSSISLSTMNRSNCRAVLAAGCLLGGMEDLCQCAYEMCRASIGLETLDEWLEFAQRVAPPPSPSSAASALSPIDGAGTETGTGAPLHHYAPRLRADVFNFVVELPKTLEMQELDQGSGERARGLLMHVFSRLPFDLFKGAVESPTFQIGSDLERFRFAKAVIEMRKRARGRSGGEETETVVLAIGSTPGSQGLLVTRKTKKRALFKVG